jgi:hypothetical protein
MAVVANQAVAFDKSMLMACPHLGDVLRPGLIQDHGLPFPNPAGESLPTIRQLFVGQKPDPGKQLPLGRAASAMR